MIIASFFRNKVPNIYSQVENLKKKFIHNGESYRNGAGNEWELMTEKGRIIIRP